MAEVYRAYHASLDRFVAVKVLHSFLSDDPEFKARFEKEAQNIAKLRHPNIVQVYDFEYDPESESYYMVMELIEGTTLRDRLYSDTEEHGSPVTLPEVLRITRESAAALSYAHQRNMIHRDVKPANLMIDQMLGSLMGALGEVLPCERCALFLRNPANRLMKMTHLWNTRTDHPLARAEEWLQHSPSLAKEDPMFGEALVNPVALFIEDISTESSDVLNFEFERDNFGHSALIHAPVHYQGQMYGILEPCVFDKPRKWSAENKALVADVQEAIASVCADYVRTHT
jgi:serine/threonine protein kinase